MLEIMRSMYISRYCKSKVMVCVMLIPVLDDRGLKIQAGVEIATLVCEKHEPHSETLPPQCGTDV